MAKLKDKLYNRIIEGKLFGLTEEDAKELSKALVNKPNRYTVKGITNIPQDILSKIKVGDIVYEGEGAYICFFYLEEDSFSLMNINETSVQVVTYSYDSDTESHWSFVDFLDTEFYDIPVNFPANTHSFNELDGTLIQIVDEAIADAYKLGVTCTSHQWTVIKALLDKSLYLNYNGLSMIKVVTNRINEYHFGLHDSSSSGSTADLSISYDSAQSLLYMDYREV